MSGGRLPALKCEARHASLVLLCRLMETGRPARIVIAKPGLDGHDRGAKVIARALRDAGHEVIYTGLHQTPAHIADVAVQEDAEFVGVSILSGAHMTLFPELIAALRDRDASDIVVFGGGIIPDADIPLLLDLGVAHIFTPGTPVHEVTEWVADHRRQPSAP